MVWEEVKEQITVTVQYGDPQGPDHALSAPIHSRQAFIPSKIVMGTLEFVTYGTLSTIFLP